MSTKFPFTEFPKTYLNTLKNYMESRNEEHEGLKNILKGNRWMVADKNNPKHKETDEWNAKNDDLQLRIDVLLNEEETATKSYALLIEEINKYVENGAAKLPGDVIESYQSAILHYQWSNKQNSLQKELLDLNSEIEKALKI